MVDLASVLPLGAGGAMVALGYLDRNPRRGVVLMAAGAGLGAWGIYRGVGVVQEVAQEAVDKSFEVPDQVAAGVPAPAGEGTGALAAAEVGLSALGRLFGKTFGPLLGTTYEEPEPGILPDPSALPAEVYGGPYLGKPKNLFGVAGVINDPIEGARVSAGLFGLLDSYSVHGAVENQSNKNVEGVLSFEAVDNLGFDAPERVEQQISLGSGQFLEVSARLPLTMVGETTLRMRWNGYLVATVSYDVF